MTKDQSIREYYFRINKSIDFIKSNLDQELSLENIASVSNFSKYHYHRIFKSVTGIPLNEYIIRARIERVLFFVKNYPHKTIGEIAFECGFATMSSFTRSFKEIQKVTAEEWNVNCTNGKNWSLEIMTENYLAIKIDVIKNCLMIKEKAIKIEIVELPEIEAMYVQNLDIDIHDSTTYSGMFERLHRWAGPENEIKFPESKALTVFRTHHNLSGNVKTDVCLTLPYALQEEGFIADLTISGGLYAVIHKESAIEECFASLEYIFEVWFVENGYQPDNRDFYIKHLNDPQTHPQNLHVFEMYIPIKHL
ncbi:AraC family transcriptional regulator [Flavobacterium sp. 2]|uniref:AraC family transcriptional regulator n=1 Tax=Flavobacterium sp. 2 TaxID=308053 RepID=UPI003CE9BDFC